MSGYGSRRDRVLDDDPHWERLMIQGLSTPTKPRPAQVVSPEPAENFARLRKAKPANFLLPASVKWLKSVPEEARPVALATRYARIVNNLAQEWNDPAACGAYFDALLVDRRGSRQGFPAAVQGDIRILLDYFLRSRIDTPSG
jgi:hypothetical protein